MSLKLGIRLQALYQVSMNTIWYQSNFYAHLIGLYVQNLAALHVVIFQVSTTT